MFAKSLKEGVATQKLYFVRPVPKEARRMKLKGKICKFIVTSANRRAETKVVSAGPSRQGEVFPRLFCGSRPTVKPAARAGGCREPGLELLFAAAQLSLVTPGMRLSGKAQRGQKPQAGTTEKYRAQGRNRAQGKGTNDAQYISLE